MVVRIIIKWCWCTKSIYEGWSSTTLVLSSYFFIHTHASNVWWSLVLVKLLLSCVLVSPEGKRSLQMTRKTKMMRFESRSSAYNVCLLVFAKWIWISFKIPAVMLQDFYNMNLSWIGITHCKGVCQVYPTKIVRQGGNRWKKSWYIFRAGTIILRGFWLSAHMI